MGSVVSTAQICAIRQRRGALFDRAILRHATAQNCSILIKTKIKS